MEKELAHDEIKFWRIYLFFESLYLNLFSTLLCRGGSSLCKFFYLRSYGWCKQNNQGTKKVIFRFLLLLRTAFFKSHLSAVPEPLAREF